MKRIAGLLVLLVFGLTRAGALECPMASAAHDGARPHAAPMAAHAHHGHPSPAGHSHSPDHGQVACGVAMSCGVAVAASARSMVPQPPVRLSAAPRRLPHLYASPVLNTDSPPPRASAAA